MSRDTIGIEENLNFKAFVFLLVYIAAFVYEYGRKIFLLQLLRSARVAQVPDLALKKVQCM